MARLTDPLATERPVAQLPRDLHLVRYEGVPASGAEGRGLEQLGSSVGQGAEEIYRAQKIEEDRINTLGAEDALTKLRNKALDLSVGQDNGFTKIKGADAINKPVMQDWTKKFQDARADIATALPNDAQRIKFGQRADLTELQYKEGILRHLAREQDSFALQSFTGTVKAESQMAAAQWDSPNDVGVSIERVRNAAHELDDHLGSKGDVRDARIRTVTGEIHAGVIQGALAANNYEYASNWLTANKDQMDQVEYLKLKREIKTTAMPVQAKQDAMAIIQPDMPAEGDMTATQIRAHIGDWSKQAEKIAEKKYPDDPIYRDLIVNQISTYANRIATAQQAQERNASNEILSVAMTPRPNGEKISDLNTLLADPAMMANWKRMEAPQQHAILQVLEHNAKGIDPPATIDALNLFHEMRGLRWNDPGAFQDRMEKDFRKLGTTLPRHQFLELISESSSIDKDLVKSQNIQASMQQIKSLDKMYEQGAGIPLPKGKDEKRKDVQDAYQNWTSRMLEGIDRFQQENKRKPSLIELRDNIAKPLLTQGYESGTGHTWFGYTFGQKKAFAFQESDLSHFAVSAPEDEAKKISDAYVKTFGREPSKQEIDQWYAVGKVKQ